MLTSSCGIDGGVAGRLEKHCSASRSPNQKTLVSLLQSLRLGPAEAAALMFETLISYSSNHCSMMDTFISTAYAVHQQQCYG
jgi:hypothetical protein